MEETQTNPADLVAKLEEIVATSPGQRLSGPTLGARLKAEFPQFDMRADLGLSLKDLVQRYSTRLHREAAADEYFLAAPDKTEAANGTQTETAPDEFFRVPQVVWFAFSQTAPKHDLIANTTTGELRVQPKGRGVPESWVLIRNVSDDEHANSARAFLATCPQQLQQEATSSIGTGPGWHRTFFEILDRAGLGGSWKRAHNRDVLKLLTDRLREYGIDVQRSRSFFPQQYNPSPARAEDRVAQVSRFQRPIEKVSHSLLRDVAARVVGNMSISELRRINVTLGDVVDALSDHDRR